jgi:microcystin-dependent protein
MAWTTPKTWAYKESLASNDMNTYVKDNFNYLKTSLDALLPTGIMWIWPTDTAPTGYLLCRGQAISRTTYSVLFAVISTTYGVGDNSTTFNLPNGAGNIFVGKDSTQTEFDTLGETGGAKTVTLAATQIPAHGHTGNTGYFNVDHNHTDSGHAHGASADSQGAHTHEYRSGDGTTSEGFAANTNADDHRQNTESAGSHGHNISVGTGNAQIGNAASGTVNHRHDFTTNDAGEGQSHNNLSPYQVANYIIKY